VTQAARRRTVVVAAAAVVLALATAAFVLAVGRGGSDAAPAGDAARFAPRGTLVWLHVSTDGDREAVSRADALLGRFDSWAALRDGLLQRLSGREEPVSEDDVSPWLGDEAALALVDTGGQTAGSLVVVGVEDDTKAREFLDEGSAKKSQSTYNGTRIDTYGAVSVAISDKHLLIGQNATVRAALDRARGQGSGLTDDPVYRRVTRDLPDDRVADAYVSRDGLRRVLMPQGGVVGTLAALLDQPGLQGASAALVPEEGRVRLRVRSALAPGTKAAPSFTPKLLDAVPEDAVAYLGSRGIGDTLGNLLLSAAGGTQSGGVAAVLGRLRTELSKETGGALQRDLLSLLDGEVAVTALKAGSGGGAATQLALIAEVRDATRTGGVLRRLQEPLAKLLTVEGEGAPTWSTQDLGDRITASTLTIPNGARLSYAIVGGRLVVATGTDAIRAVASADGGLAESDRLDEMGESRPGEVTSLGLLDFSQLLELGEQTGLSESRAYLAARDDLRKIRAVGVRSHGDEGETTAEILLSIP